MAKKIDLVSNISNIKLSLILVVLICAILFFVYLRKERFHNIQDMLNMEPSEVRSKLENIKSCIKNPNTCSEQKRDLIITDLDTLINLSKML